ncbi:YggW family oxidoreductase, partial [Haemophilus influenzae]
YTGLSQSAVKNQIDFAIQQNYIVENADSWQITEHGKLFLNELLELFLTEE